MATTGHLLLDTNKGGRPGALLRGGFGLKGIFESQWLLCRFKNIFSQLIVMSSDGLLCSKKEGVGSNLLNINEQ